MDENLIENYFLAIHRSALIDILSDPDLKKHFSIAVNFVELFENDTKLGNQILKTPTEALRKLDEKLLNVEENLISQLSSDVCTVKPNIHGRVYGLPVCPELHRTIFPKNDDLNLYLQIRGTVIRVGSPNILEYKRKYVCTKCKYATTVEAVYNRNYAIFPPKKCENPNNCTGSNLNAIGELNADNCRDYQEIKIQEETSKLGIGTIPSSILVTLEDDLVDICKPGDDVTICGIVKRRWDSLTIGKKLDIELVIKANHVQVNNGCTFPHFITIEEKTKFTSFWNNYRNCPLQGRDMILKSFCPNLFGMYLVKLAVLVVLAGGNKKREENETGTRSESHLLLVGDPGTGKSQLLRYAAKLTPRSVLTTGIGSTSAGLTVAAVMENGQWHLEGGALVLADGGICCIDEFNSMKSHDRASIHEAMEQQTISVAKGGIVSKLHTQCSILAATNPKGGHLDPSQPLSLNLTLPSPLLSRFDLVIMLKDSYNSEWDNILSDYILNELPYSNQSDEPLWNLEMLQQYFSIIKDLNPMLTLKAREIISKYYQAQRQAASRNKARTTVRLLDSLIRLSQAHAKLMFRKQVMVVDALFAVLLIESSMHGECAVLSLDKINVLAPFLTDPMEDYAQIARAILTQLGLDTLLESEIEYLRSLNSGGPESSDTCTAFSKQYQNSSNSYIKDFNKEDNISDFNKSDLRGERENLIKAAELDQKNVQMCNSNELNNLIKVDNLSSEEHLLTQSESSKFPINHEIITKEKWINKTFNNLSKKRVKQSKNHKNPKKSKSFKLPDALMLNLIPSVNDDFDCDILNFGLNSDSKEINVDILENKTQLGYGNEKISEVNVRDPVHMPNGKLEEIDKKDSSEKLSIIQNESNMNNTLHLVNEATSYTSEKRLSQNSKLKKFKEKFSFKPNMSSKEICNSNENVSKIFENDAVSNSSIFSIKGASTPIKVVCKNESISKKSDNFNNTSNCSKEPIRELFKCSDYDLKQCHTLPAAKSVFKPKVLLASKNMEHTFSNCILQQTTEVTYPNKPEIYSDQSFSKFVSESETSLREVRQGNKMILSEVPSVESNIVEPILRSIFTNDEDYDNLDF